MVHKVTIKNYAFSPPVLQISAGDHVRWQNADGVRHSAKRDDPPVFDTGLLSLNEESEEVAIEAEPGSELEYYCEPHPHMRGRIVIAP